MISSAAAETPDAFQRAWKLPNCPCRGDLRSWFHLMVPWDHASQSPSPKRHLDRFSRFSTAHPCSQHTDGQTSMSHAVHENTVCRQNVELMPTRSCDNAVVDVWSTRRRRTLYWWLPRRWRHHSPSRCAALWRHTDVSLRQMNSYIHANLQQANKGIRVRFNLFRITNAEKSRIIIGIK